MRKRGKRHYCRPFSYVTLAEALNETLRLPNIRRHLRAAELSQGWEAAVGPEVSVHVRPQSLDRGILTLKADSSVWRQHIRFIKPELLDRISETFRQHKVRDILVK